MGGQHDPSHDDQQTKHGRRRRGPSLMRLVTLALVAAAVTKELRKDKEDRTWHGTLAGFVPYELRMPTVDRFRERVWDPEGEHLIGPRVFGVGWTLNLGRVVAVVRQRVAERRAAAGEATS